MNIVVLGAGAWGTALAISAAGQANARRHVTLWARDAQQATDLQQHRENRRYLSGVAVPVAVQITTGPLHSGSSLLDGADLVIVATPMAGLRDMLTLLASQRAPVAWLCKGFEAPTTQATGLLGHEVRAQVAPDLQAGVLSGPSFALEVARGQPTALVAASEHAHVRDTLVTAFHSPTLRVYANDDIVGVEVGGAVKNVLAIATGLCDGLGLGMNARAALITRGLTEMTRLGLALGAKAETFRPLAQPQGGPVARAGHEPAAGGGFARPCGRRCLQRAHRGAACPVTGCGHAHHRRGGGFAGRAPAARAGGGPAHGARPQGRVALIKRACNPPV